MSNLTDEYLSGQGDISDHDNISEAAFNSASMDPSRGLEVALNDVWPVFAIAGQEGVSFPDILAHLGLKPDLLDDPNDYIPLVDYFRIIGQLSLFFYDETCKLSDRPLILGTAKFVLKNLADCGTVREAMNKLAEVSNVLNGGPFNQVRDVDDQIQFIIDDKRFPYVLDDQAFLFFGMECILMLLHGMFEYLVNPDEPLPRPQVSIKRSADTRARHLIFWSGRIRHKAENYVMSYPKNVGDLALSAPPSGYAIYDFFQKVIDLAEAPHADLMFESMTQRVRRELLIDEKIKDQQQVANLLGVSIATLRRRLKEEGTSFRDIRQLALKTLAIRLLDAGFHPGEVAEKLGFSDLRSFSRAFKKWHHTTPSEYLTTKE